MNLLRFHLASLSRRIPAYHEPVDNTLWNVLVLPFRTQRAYLDNVTLNEWSAGPSETVLLYVPGGGALIPNDRGEEWYRAIFRVAFGKAPNAQRLFGGCSHG